MPTNKKSLRLWLAGSPVKKSIPLYLSKALVSSTPKPPPIPSMIKPKKQPKTILTPHVMGILSHVPDTLGGKSMEADDEESEE